jgi:hypothetical protein
VGNNVQVLGRGRGREGGKAGGQGEGEGAREEDIYRCGNCLVSARIVYLVYGKSHLLDVLEVLGSNLG